MAPKLSKEVVVKAVTHFLPEYSRTDHEHFMFSYNISIRNEMPEAVQLLSRHWYIFDSNNSIKEVKGEGVVGQQPIIEPNREHTYQSYCELSSDIGLMWGNYLMKNLATNKLFEVKIPQFELITPSRLN
jgi:ApaG protein